MEVRARVKGSQTYSSEVLTRSLAYVAVVRFVPAVTWWTMVFASILFAPYAAAYAFNFVPAIEAMVGGYYGKEKEQNCSSQTVHKLPLLALLWGVHSTAALVFIATAPFQFNQAFRYRHLSWHRALGYAFIASSVVAGVTGGWPMAVVTDFGPVAALASHVASPYFLFSLFMALYHIRTGNQKTHREWMIRTCSFGYAVIAMRFIPQAIQRVYGMCLLDAVALSFWFCWIAAVALAELFIQVRYHGFLAIVPPTDLEKEL